MKAIEGRFILKTCLVVLSTLTILQSYTTVRAQSRSDSQSIPAFFDAISENDTNHFSQMLEGDTNLTHALYYGRLPLHVAASKGRLEMVVRLLKHGADIDAKGDTLETSNGRLTALEAAIWYGHPEVCKYLLEAGADPNIQSPFDGGALHYAFAYHRMEMAGWLLDYGADPFLVSQNEYKKLTPLEMAISQSDGTLVPRMLGQDRKNPLGSKSRAKVKPAGAHRQPLKTGKDILGERGGAMLTAAAQRGELEAVEALLKAGAPVQSQPDSGYTMLQTFGLSEAPASKAASFPLDRWLQIRDLLIKHGAVYDAFAATALGDLKRSQELMTADKSVVQSRDHQEESALHWAVRTDRQPLTTFWLEAGVPISATNLSGQTALHLAAANGLAGQVKLLLAAHAPTQVRDANGWTPLDAAIHAQQTETIRLLLDDKNTAPHPDRGIATALHEAAASDNIVRLASLTEAATNLEVRNELGLTPLQVAVESGRLGAAALLVDKGADVNVRDPEGNTLLHRLFVAGPRLTVYDRPPTKWLDRMGEDPRKATYVKYLTVGQYEQGPNPLLQTASFLLACGIDAKAANRAGKTVSQLAADKEATQRAFLFDGDLAALLKLLGTGGGNVNETDAEGNTALHLAGGVTDADRAAALIASGADVNATNHLGRTPLHAFAEHIGGWDMDEAGTNAPFQLLLKSKANVNAQDNQGMTPLHVVAASESTFKKEATKALLEAGANPNLRDKQGRTAVHLFLGGKWPWSEARECIALLVSAGADLSLKDESGKTLLHYLAAMGNQTPLFFVRGITNTLAANKADLMVRDNEGNTPLHVAAKTGTYDVLDWLVKRGADLDATNNAGETPRILMARNPDPFARVGAQSAETDIFQAVREGKVDAAARLVAADPQLVNQTNQVRQTPLRLAVVLHRTNMMDFLEAHGAKWDETTAVLAGRRDALQAILKEKPSAVDTMEFGKGLIHIAASKGDMDTVKILIAANCDIQAVDNWGMSALGRALVDKHKEVQELLRQHGARENFFDAIYANDLPTVTTLLAQDRSLVSARNRGNVAAMDIAAAAGYTDILKLLLKQHADMDSATSANSRTPLHLAAFYNQTNTLALLIRQGAKVNQVDALGFAPLHWATIRGAKEAAAMLLNLKADANQAVTQSGHNDNMMMGPNRGNLIGDTPLHLAALCGETNIVQLLLKSKADVNATNAIFQTPLDLTTGQRPMNPFGIFMVQRGMLVLLEPLGVNQGLEKANRTGQSTAAALIEAAGGKQNHQQLRGRPAFAYPN